MKKTVTRNQPISVETVGIAGENIPACYCVGRNPLDNLVYKYSAAASIFLGVTEFDFYTNEAVSAITEGEAHVYFSTPVVSKGTAVGADAATGKMMAGAPITHGELVEESGVVASDVANLYSCVIDLIQTVN